MLPTDLTSIVGAQRHTAVPCYHKRPATLLGTPIRLNCRRGKSRPLMAGFTRHTDFPHRNAQQEILIAMAFPTLDQLLSKYAEFASLSPEQTRGNFRSQLKCCKILLLEYKREDTLQILNEIANTDPKRTRGRDCGQRDARKMIVKYLRAKGPVKTCKN